MARRAAPLLLLLALALRTGRPSTCPDPEPPLARSAAQLAPAAPPPGCPAPPAPPPPWVFEHNASQSFTQPTQATLQHPAAAAAAAARAACPHLDPALTPWALPTSGDVTLPPGAAVLLSACALPPNGTLALRSLTIPAGARLVIGDSPLHLTAASIVVRGALTAGSPTCRLRSAISITLTGARPAPLQAASAASDAYAKGIVVEGSGALDLHAERYAPTWTRLAAPASAGAEWVFLQVPVNWEPGQTFIVTTTALKDARDYSETEELRLLCALTLPNGMAALHFTPPLRHSHYAGPEYQAEVALLSRRLTVAGSEADSAPTDAQPALCAPSPEQRPYFAALPCGNASLTGYGGHVMVAGPGAVGRLSGVLLLRMGQTNYLARYPFHLHMLNASGSGSYLHDSAVWRSYYRCASIHGTSGATVAANVAHDVVGHCFYLEDGVEENNTFAYNLASLVHPLFGGAGNYFPTSGPGQSQEFGANLGVSPTLTLPADATASGFYISNAHNRYVGNAASGGWAGFAFPSLATPVNQHRAFPMSPLARPTLEFRGNSAHSSGYYWSAAGCLYVGGALTYGPGGASATLIYNPGRSSSVNPSGVSVSHALTTFNDTKLYLCNGVGLQHWGSVPALYGLETHDIVRAANFFGTAVANNWLVTCRTANKPTYASVPKPGYQETAFISSERGALFQSYDVGQSHIVTNLTFRNCSSPRQTFKLLQMLTHSDQFTPDSMIVTAGLRFEGAGGASSPHRLGVTVNASKPTVSHLMQSWGDADGSLSGRGRPTLLGSSRQGWWWRLDGACENRADWTMWACDLPPTRSTGAIFFLFNATAQSAAPAGTLGVAACSNGNYAAVPCPAVGRVWHLGYAPDTAMDLPLNAKLSGPVGGFGWVVGGSAWRAPLVLNLTNVQVSPEDALLLVLPYPPGSRFTVTALSTNSFNTALRGQPLPSWCFVTGARGRVVGDNLCTFTLRAVGSAAEVRGGAGDTYFFDDATGHLYLRPTVHSQHYSFLGVPNASAPGAVGRVWGLQQARGWAAQGLALPPRGGNVITITTDCGGAVDGAYCAAPGGNGGALPASPCPPGVALPLSAFDSCASGGAAPPPPPPPPLLTSASPTPMPTPSPTPSLSPGASPSCSPSAAPAAGAAGGAVEGGGGAAAAAGSAAAWAGVGAALASPGGIGGLAGGGALLVAAGAGALAWRRARARAGARKAPLAAAPQQGRGAGAGAGGGSSRLGSGRLPPQARVSALFTARAT